MAVTFNTDIGSEDATSYAEVSEANQYAEDYGLAAWIALDGGHGDLKKQYLNKAAQFIDGNYEFRGEKTSDDQALEWPRSGVTRQDGTELPSDTIPRSIKSAQIEAANYFASGVDLTADQGPAATREKLEGLGEIEYRDYGISSAAPVRTRIDQLLKFPLVETGSASGNLRMILA
jgi:hypothetical protein